MTFRTLNIKYFMVLYVGALLAWGAFQMGEPTYLWKGLAIAALYIIFDLLWTYFRDGTWYLPSSSVISGFILAVVGAPAPSLDLLVLLPLVAVASKQLITFWKPRHIFNPAAFSMAVLTLAGYSAVSWWGVAWGTPVLYAVLLVGIFILWRQKRWETTLSFLGSYGVFLAALFLWQGREADELFAILKPQILDGTTLFFASVMLIEPITSNFRGTKNRVIYGILVGAVAVLATAFGQYFFELDPLLSGLLIGNFIISIITI
ncbi:MAG: RnfABCDGE type electron transport complex subunit D [bacterium]|nr:RnfABCDGE type electron transport complex subunit D [bacterium]